MYVRPLCRMLILLLVFQLVWLRHLPGATKQANYDTSLPGTDIFWSDPLGQGGMNLVTGKMTKVKD
jgi:hypothetical protein